MILAKAGLAKDDVTMVVTGNNPGKIQFIKDRRVDCFMCTLDVAMLLERAGEPIVYWSVDRYAPMPSYVHVTRRDVVGKGRISCSVICGRSRLRSPRF